MLVKMMFHHDPLVEKAETGVRGILEDEDDEEETLSFCEFSINSDSDLWGNSSRESSQNSSFKSSEEENCFEFFSQELSTGGSSFSSNPPPKNIIFCGKLISYKEPTTENSEKVGNIKSRKHKKIKRGIFRWKWNYFSSFHKTKNRKRGSKSTGHDQKEESSSSSYKSFTAEPESTSKHRSNTRKKSNKEHDLSVPKMSLFTASTSKLSSRWYLFFFGITKYRTQMELRDMKIRQSRSRSSSSFHNNESTVCMNKNKGLWAVLRALSCGTSEHRINVLVETSTVAAGS